LWGFTLSWGLLQDSVCKDKSAPASAGTAEFDVRAALRLNKFYTTLRVDNLDWESVAVT
jgi:hypothetical protein